MNKFLKFVVASVLAATTLASYAASFVGERSDFRDETIYFAITTRFCDGDPTNNVCGWDRQSVQIAILRKTFFAKSCRIIAKSGFICLILQFGDKIAPQK